MTFEELPVSLEELLDRDDEICQELANVAKWTGGLSPQSPKYRDHLSEVLRTASIFFLVHPETQEICGHGLRFENGKSVMCFDSLEEECS